MRSIEGFFSTALYTTHLRRFSLLCCSIATSYSIRFSYSIVLWPAKMGFHRFPVRVYYNMLCKTVFYTSIYSNAQRGGGFGLFVYSSYSKVKFLVCRSIVTDYPVLIYYTTLMQNALYTSIYSNLQRQGGFGLFVYSSYSKVTHFLYSSIITNLCNSLLCTAV